jgi:hypothetical protein
MFTCLYFMLHIIVHCHQCLIPNICFFQHLILLLLLLFWSIFMFWCSFLFLLWCWNCLFVCHFSMLHINIHLQHLIPNTIFYFF